jgi:hypothetical protein
MSSVVPITQEVPRNTPFSAIQSGIPSEVLVTFDSGDEFMVGVTFGDFSPTYNGAVAGSYTATGVLATSQWLTNPNNVVMTITAVVL